MAKVCLKYMKVQSFNSSLTPNTDQTLTVSSLRGVGAATCGQVSALSVDSLTCMICKLYSNLKTSGMYVLITRQEVEMGT